MGKVKGTPGGVTSRRVHDSAPPRGKDEAEAEVDQKEILAKKPDQKVKWMAKAMQLAVKGTLKVTVLYDILAHPKFATGFGRGIGRQARSLVDTHLHLFSAKQQKFLQSDACKFSSFEAVAVAQQGNESESEKEQRGSPAKDSVADANDTAPGLTSDSAVLEPAVGVGKATFKFSFGKKRDEDDALNALEAAAEAKKQKDKEKQEAKEKAKNAGDGADAAAKLEAATVLLRIPTGEAPHLQQPVNLLKQLAKPSAQPAKELQKPGVDSRSSTDGDSKQAADAAGKEVALVVAPAKKHASRSRSRRRRSRSRRRSSGSRSRRRKSSRSKKRSLQDIINDKVERMTAR